MSSEVATMIEEALAAVFERHLPAVSREDDGWSPELWSALDEAGFAFPDPSEGDFGLEEALAVAIAVGRVAAPVPLADTAGLVSWLLARAGIGRPPGLTVAAGLHPVDDLVLRPSGSGFVASGSLHRVPWGRVADHVVAMADVDGAPGIVVLPQSEEVREGENLAREPRDRLVYHGLPVGTDVVATIRAPAVEEVRARAALLRAASAAGAMESVLALVVEYSRTRRQFGRPIGAYQAVQQHLVRVAEAAASTKLGVQATALAPAEHRLFAAASAVVVARAESSSLARSAHQVFGAIGVTEEHPLHVFTTRLWSWQDEFGTTDDWSRFLGRSALGKNVSTVWGLVSATPGTGSPRGLGESVAW